MKALLRDRMRWPFFDAAHGVLVEQLDDWTATSPVPHNADLDAACRAWVRALGEAGWLRYCVPGAWGGAHRQVESRSVTLIRECLAAHDGLADFAMAMQGLGSGAIALAGTDALKGEWLPRVARGDAIAAFALTEPEAGSDVGAMQARAMRVGDHYEITGEKSWISNGGIADFYTVFARTDATSSGSKGISAFLVPANAGGLTVAERLDVIAPHPLARLRFDRCAVPSHHRLGGEGDGFKLAMRTLDLFRVTVAGAALGFARRALAEALRHATTRPMFGGTLATQPLALAMLGDMATDFDAAALLTYRAAWQRDTTDERTTREAAMAKLMATELAQTIIDRAVQLHGARGVQTGVIVERLYREIRALRIYEGASEVQRLIIGRETVAAASRRGT